MSRIDQSCQADTAGAIEKKGLGGLLQRPLAVGGRRKESNPRMSNQIRCLNHLRPALSGSFSGFAAIGLRKPSKL